MRTITVTVGPLAAASANNICLSQTPTSAFTLNGALVASGVATLDAPRRVLFTQAAGETGKTYTIVGTTWGGAAQTEVLNAAAAATAVESNLDFLTVTSITISAGAAGAITVGTDGVASSAWVSLSDYGSGQSTALQCTVSGTVNYTVQETMEDPNSPTNAVLPYNVTWVSSSDTNVVAATTTQGSVAGALVKWVRVLLNSGTGSVSMAVSQADFGGGGGGSSGGAAGSTTVKANAASPTWVEGSTTNQLSGDLHGALRVLVDDSAGVPVDWTAPVGVTQSTSPWVVAGGGAAGTAATGVVTVQGIASMTPVQITGTGTAGASAAGVISVQGIASGTALGVSFSASALTDGSSTITLGGTAQTLFAAAAVVNGYEVVNPDPSEDLWISDTTTAAANGTGSIRVAANGGSYSTPTGMKPSAAVSIIGATTGHKFTARRW